MAIGNLAISHKSPRHSLASKPGYTAQLDKGTSFHVSCNVFR